MVEKCLVTSVKGKIYAKRYLPNQYDSFLSAEKLWKRVFMQRLLREARMSERLVQFMTRQFSGGVEVTIL